MAMQIRKENALKCLARPDTLQNLSCRLTARFFAALYYSVDKRRPRLVLHWFIRKTALSLKPTSNPLLCYPLAPTERYSPPRQRKAACFHDEGERRPELRPLKLQLQTGAHQGHRQLRIYPSLLR